MREWIFDNLNRLDERKIKLVYRYIRALLGEDGSRIPTRKKGG